MMHAMATRDQTEKVKAMKEADEDQKKRRAKAVLEEDDMFGEARKQPRNVTTSGRPTRTGMARPAADTVLGSLSSKVRKERCQLVVVLGMKCYDIGRFLPCADGS